MNILIIEDDNFKADSIKSFLIQNFTDISLKLVSSLVEAIQEIKRDQFDFVLIDMAIPSHPIRSGGGSPMSLLTGGLQVVFELNSLNRKDRCIIITQYPEIEISGQLYPVEKAKAEILKNYEIEVVACIEYSEKEEAWKFLLMDSILT